MLSDFSPSSASLRCGSGSNDRKSASFEPERNFAAVRHRDRLLTLTTYSWRHLRGQPEHPVTTEDEVAPALRERLVHAVGAWSGQHPSRPARMSRGEPAVLRVIAPLALLVFAAIV